MARPTTIDYQHILEVAREVFLSEGMHATTAEVAARAGISEGSLFKRYKTKIGLFRAAMHMSDCPIWLRDLPSSVGQGDIQTQLEKLAQNILAFYRTLAPLMMMSWSNEGFTEAMSEVMKQELNPRSFNEGIAQYFASEMKLGRLRQVNPYVCTRLFSGALHMTAVHDLMPLPIAPKQSDRSITKAHVAMFLNGLSPIQTRGQV